MIHCPLCHKERRQRDIHKSFACSLKSTFLKSTMYWQEDPFSSFKKTIEDSQRDKFGTSCLSIRVESFRQNHAIKDMQQQKAFKDGFLLATFTRSWILFDVSWISLVGFTRESHLWFSLIGLIRCSHLMLHFFSTSHSPLRPPK